MNPNHPQISLYLYKAIVTDVYDGDTITVDIDLGLSVWVRGERIRLFGINAPEMRGPEREEGVVSLDFLRSRILGKKVVLRTVPSPKGKDKKGKYGRYLATVFYDGVNINNLLVTEGYAKEASY